MLVIIIGIIICFVFYKTVTKDMKDEKLASYEVVRFYCSIIGAAYLILAILIALCFPTKYGEWEKVSETQLVTLANSTVTEGGGAIYVTVSGRNIYTYRHEKTSEFGTSTSKEYVVKTVSGNVMESEDVNCKNPVLLEYRRKSKITIWTFGFLTSETMYVFYVPEGTIQKDISLK